MNQRRIGGGKHILVRTVIVVGFLASALLASYWYFAHPPLPETPPALKQAVSIDDVRRATKDFGIIGPFSPNSDSSLQKFAQMDWGGGR